MVDIALKENGDIHTQTKLVAGRDEVIQRVRIRLNTFLGEYPLDSRVGIPWIQWQSLRGIPVDQIGERIRLEVATTDGVLRVTNFSATKNGDRVEVDGTVVLEDDVEPVSLSIALSPSSGITRVRIA